MQGMRVNFDEMFPKYPDMLEEEEICLNDYQYIKRLYPKQLRLICVAIEEYLDRYEYEGSPIYVQYPDQISIYRMADAVYRQFSFEGSKEELEKMRDMIGLMVCQEIYVRRRRHDRFVRQFHQFGMR